MYLNTNTLVRFKYNYKYHEMLKYLNINTLGSISFRNTFGQSSSNNSNVANRDSGKLDMGKGEYSG